MTDFMHIGTPRHSGRYPWGSGDNPYQRNVNFLGYVKNLKNEGFSQVEIARGLGMTTSQLKTRLSIASNENRQANASQALRLKDKGYSNVAIGQKMGINESSVRSLLNPALKARADILTNTTKMLKDQIKEKKYIDVGAGVEQYLNISQTKLQTSIEALKNEGYELYYIKVPQLGTGKDTRLKVLVPPGTTYSELSKNRDAIKSINTYSEDGGRTYLGVEKPRSIDSKTVKINYREDGGSAKDGIIEIRRGVPELSLGESRYKQVRIAVDGTHYIKGVAVYSDNLPKGVNVLFNTDKSKVGKTKKDVLQPMKDDPDNPFGAVFKPNGKYKDKDGKTQQSAMNVIREEGDWYTWKNSLSSQVLSKQSPILAKQQLSISLAMRKEELSTIKSLTNPTVKKKLLLSYADNVDSATSDLKAAAMPRQRNHVILPISKMKDNEVYAPNYRHGETVKLVRFPHGGIFEIPTLKVNNKVKEAKKLIGRAIDAVGINSKVAARLSGADFDGDFVLVIPDSKGRLKTSKALAGLKDFDPKISYPKYDGMKPMSSKTKQLKMGEVSNLVTDMHIKGASQSEITRAVKHSMVVIDAEKHQLNYKQSFVDNGISELKKKYQGGARKGASTLISRASSEARIPHAKPRSSKEGGPIDKKTGELMTTPTGETYINKQGKTIKRTTKTTQMALYKDANKLSSGTPMESVYASYANQLKALANQARKDAVNTKHIPYSPSAKKAYAKEVKSLESKLRIAQRNRPLERQAQILANAVVKAKREGAPDMDKDTLKKIKGQALTEARRRVGAKKENIVPTPKEWEAIQAGAISTNQLNHILGNTNLNYIRELATPRKQKAMSPGKMSRASSMLARGMTQAEVADALGVSVSTLVRALD